MRILTKSLAALLALSIGAQPVLATNEQAPLAPSAARGAAVSLPSLPTLPALGIDAHLLTLTSALTVPTAGVNQARVVHAASAIVAQRLQAASARAAKAVESLPSSGAAGAHSASQAQFDALVGGRSLPEGFVDDAPIEASGADASAPLLLAGQADNPPPAPPKGFHIFHEPARNRSFWLYLTGSMIFLFGFELYLVGMPFLVSSMTKNSLRAHHDPRLANPEALNALIRSNRSITRVAHYSAQAVSYALAPLISRKAGEEPQPWLSRSMLLRAVVLSAISALFFATGLMTIGASIGLLAVVMAAASFFQGMTVTRETVGTARLMGDPSVTDAERTKANSILSVASSLNSIIAPAFAGHLATIRDILGKSGSGCAVIYAIYSGLTAMASFAWRGVAIFKEKRIAGQDAAPATGPPGFWDNIKELGRSLRDGTKLFYRNKFLRVMVLMTMVNDLFSDPLAFNVLPEYAEKIIAAHSTIGHLLRVPVLGWFLTGLTSTPMGYFSFMVVISSLGAIAGAMLIKPARRLLQKLGYRSEESMLKPFYFLAVLEAPLFWFMMRSHSMLGVLALYGLQALVTYFGALTASGVQQKALDQYSNAEQNKLIAAESFIGVLVAILSTIAYGFVLKGISLQTSMLIAGVAIAGQALIRMISPWLAFTKEQRKRQPPPKAS